MLSSNISTCLFITPCQLLCHPISYNLFGVFFCPQILDLISTYKGLAEIFMQRRDQVITAHQLFSVVKPVYSPLGSPRRASEELVLANALTFAIAAEGRVMVSIIIAYYSIQ